MDWMTLEENDLMDGDNHLNQRNEESKHDMETEILKKSSQFSMIILSTLNFELY